LGVPDNGIAVRNSYTKIYLIKKLGISDLTLDHYMKLFTTEKRSRSVTKASFLQVNSNDRIEWKTYRKYVWSEMDLLRHLAGKTALSLYWTEFADYLMLDFDTHKNRSEEYVRDAALKVIQALPGEWLTYQSSFSKGIRAICFLDQRYSRFGLFNYLKTKLKAIDSGNEYGWVESRMGNASDRLPFGKGSMLLDPFTLEPMFDLNLEETIRYAWKFAEENRLTPDEKDFKRVGVFLGRTGKDYNAVVNRLLTEGLWPEINTNDALLALNLQFQGVNGLTREEAALKLKEWTQMKTNGLSQRINNGNFAGIDSQIDRIVASFDPKRFNRKNKVSASSEASLSLADVKTLLSYTSDYRMLKAAFSLLRYVAGRRSFSVTIISHDFMSPQRGCNNVSRNSCDLVVPIPWTAFRKFAGFPENDPARKRKELERLGILKLKREYSADDGRCREYTIFFPFSSDRTPAFSLLDEALARLMDPKELRKNFGDYRATKILATAKREQGVENEH
jgi:hypothetical protein